MKRLISTFLAVAMAVGMAIPVLAASFTTSQELVIGFSQEKVELTRPGESVDIMISSADGTVISRADGKSITETWFKDNFNFRISNKKGGIQAELRWDNDVKQPYIRVKMPITTSTKHTDYNLKVSLTSRKGEKQETSFVMSGTVEYDEQSPSEYMYVTEDEPLMVNFKDSDRNSDYELSYGDYATAKWRTYENTRKIFGFKANDNDNFLSKYTNKFDNLDFFQMTFVGSNTFGSEAKVTFHTNLTDAKAPAMYTLASDGTLVELRDVTYNKNGDFSIKTKSLSGGYLMTDKKVEGVTTSATTSSSSSSSSTTTGTGSSTTTGGKDNPQTGVATNYMPLLVAITAISMAGGVVLAKKRK